MVCFNSARMISAAVRSFLDQKHDNKELLVVDGLSNDDTLDVLRSFPQETIRILSEKDHGIYDAMNKGLRDFSGDAVGFLNSDDEFYDGDVLSRIAGALEKTDAAYGDLNMVDAGNRTIIRRIWKAGRFSPGAFRRGWMPPHPTFYVRRRLVESVGTFRTDLRISADYDFMLRALEIQKPRVSYIPHTLINFTIGGKSTENLRAVINGNLECLQSRREHLGAGILDLALFLKPARKILQLRSPK